MTEGQEARGKRQERNDNGGMHPAAEVLASIARALLHAAGLLTGHAALRDECRAVAVDVQNILQDVVELPVGEANSEQRIANSGPPPLIEIGQGEYAQRFEDGPEGLHEVQS